MGHYDFGQLLPAKRDSGQLHADAAEASTKTLRRLLPSKGELPARRVLAPAGAATTEQREQQAEEQREQSARAHHTFALIGLCGEQRLSAGSRTPLHSLARRSSPTHPGGRHR